jgi:hypothetical protein
MSATPYIERVAQNIEATIIAVANIANGYNYDWTASQVLELKQDLDTASIVGPNRPTASVYWSEFDQKQQGDEANYSQVEVHVHFHVDICVAIQAKFRTEITAALADIERAVMKDISQGGTCINTFTQGATTFALNSNGTADASLHFDVVVRHAANDPSAEYQTTYN